MIAIHRPQPGPTILLNEGAAEEQSLCDRYDAGEREFNFKPGIYRHAAVLEALKHSHHSKCCYCEQISDTDGDVEHYRPKTKYYWLTYRWDNLLLACADCNRAKQHKFPVADEATRATTHHLDHRLEQPLMLDPTADDIDSHLGWRNEVAFPKQPTGPGVHTIATVKLNRISLVKRRMEALGYIDQLLMAESALGDDPVALRIRAYLDEKQSQRGPFSAMIRSYLRSKV